MRKKKKKNSWKFLLMLWIRNDLVRIRILTFKPGQLNNYQIFSVHNGTAARFFFSFYDILGKYICTQRRIGPFEDKFSDFLAKKVWSGSDFVKTFRIRPDPDPQYGFKSKIFALHRSFLVAYGTGTWFRIRTHKRSKISSMFFENI